MLDVYLVVGGAIVLTALLLFPTEFFASMWFFLSPTADRGLRRHKRELLAQVHGTVLEIGAGRGSNIKYYDCSKVTRLILVEPNRHMHNAIRAEALRCGFRHVTISDVSASALPYRSGSVDFVVSTLVLCSVLYVRAAVSEVHRVLKHGGRFLFIEHVGDRRGTVRRALQSALYVPWKVVGDGCHLDRDTEDTVRLAPWVDVRVHTAAQSKGMWIAQPMLVGEALKG